MSAKVLDSSNCKAEPQQLKPLINQAKCEGASDCLKVCPYNVFEVRKLAAVERKELPLTARLKVAVHGGKQAFVIHPEACHSCGLCIQACPEKAIRLIKF